jgi:hypothetical protein
LTVVRKTFLMMSDGLWSAAIRNMPKVGRPVSIANVRNHYQFLLCGFGCEYSLSPLARYLAERGYRTIAVDMQDTPLPEEIAGPLVFISSQHPACSSLVFQAHWGETQPFCQYVAPLEIRQRLRPACSVFIPHDLETPIRPEELVYMSAFDLYAAPSGPINPALGHYCKVIKTGWIKHNQLDQIAPDIEAIVAERGLMFVNQIVQVLLRGGARYLLSSYPEILAKGLPVKLPVWPGCDALEKELAALGALVLPAALPSTSLIAASRAVYVNCPGSVVTEARYLNVPVTVLRSGAQEVTPQNNTTSKSLVPPFNFPLLLESIDLLLGAHR